MISRLYILNLFATFILFGTFRETTASPLIVRDSFARAESSAPTIVDPELNRRGLCTVLNKMCSLGLGSKNKPYAEATWPVEFMLTKNAHCAVIIDRFYGFQEKEGKVVQFRYERNAGELQNFGIELYPWRGPPAKDPKGTMWKNSFAYSEIMNLKTTEGHFISDINNILIENQIYDPLSYERASEKPGFTDWVNGCRKKE